MKKLSMSVISLFVSTMIFAENHSAFQDYYNGHYQEAEQSLLNITGDEKGKALYMLANMKMRGYGVPTDFADGLQNMIKAGDLNYVPAQMFLAQYYLNTKQDLPEAVKWFKKAADNGNQKAILFTGVAYMNGYGVKKNNDIARKYIIESAKSGYPLAQYELAKLFLNSQHSGDRKMGQIWLLKAAESGHANAQYLLGSLLYSGKSFTKDQAKAREWLLRAEKQGNDDAKNMLQTMTINNVKSVNVTVSAVSSEKNESKVEKPELTTEQQRQIMINLMSQAKVPLKNLDILAAHDHQMTPTPKMIAIGKETIIQPNYNLVAPHAIPMDKIILNVARSEYPYFADRSLELNYPFELPEGASTNAQAYAMLKREAEFGYPRSLYQLGQMYEQGIEVPKNMAKAAELYQKAAEQGYAKGEYRLGMLYLNGNQVERNYTLGLQLLNAAAMKGSRKAQYALGVLYEGGLKDDRTNQTIDKNPEKAHAFYMLSAQNGDHYAQQRLAQMYAAGLLNPHHDMALEHQQLELARQLYQKSTKEANNRVKLAEAYFNASPSVSKEKQLSAFQVAQSFADKNDPAGHLLLGILYDRGIGVDQDRGDAIEQYRLAAKSGNPFAELMLGTHAYLNGDKQTALHWLKAAADQNNQYAKFALAIMAKKGDYPGQDFMTLLNQVDRNQFSHADLLLADDYLANGQDKKSLQQAADIYTKLAEKNDSNAELKLGYMYGQGIYFPKDQQKALAWYQKSADHQNPLGQFLLAKQYQMGDGVPRNINMAIKYYTASAQQGFVPAQVALGFVYEIDQQNLAEAKKWYKTAAEHNSAEGKYNLELLDKKLG